MADKIFVNGLISKDIPETTPEFILGKNSIHVDSLIKWLQEVGKGLADEKGYVNTVTLRSKTTGKRYIEVDTWKPKATEQPKDESPSVKVGGYEGTLANGEAKTEDIPF